jgi:pilus assembly protein CpaB
MGRRTLLLIAALVVAALGTTGVFLYVNGVDERASAGYDLVTVLVATAAIDAGTSARDALADGSIDERQYLRKSFDELPGALSDVTPIADQVALAPIAAGEPILASQFGAPSDSSQLPIPEGQLAVSVQLDDPARVAGFVGNQSEVAIMLTVPDDAGGHTTRVLLDNVTVIAVGPTTRTSDAEANGSQTSDVPTTILTLAVDQTQAEKIVYGQSVGDLYLALRGKDAQVDPDSSGITAKNLFD